MKTLMVKFKGDKEQLHSWLKEWTNKSDRTMNGTIIELIEKHLNSLEDRG